MRFGDHIEALLHCRDLLGALMFLNSPERGTSPNWEQGDDRGTPGVQSGSATSRVAVGEGDFQQQMPFSIITWFAVPCFGQSVCSSLYGGVSAVTHGA